MNLLDRRTFFRQASAAAGVSFLSPANLSRSALPPKKISVAQVSTNFEREPLATPYGFKGRAAAMQFAGGGLLLANINRNFVANF